MKWRKRNVLTGLAVALVLLISATGTIAYLTTRTETVNNLFAFPSTDVDILEDVDGWDLKQVQVKNTSEEVPGVARVMLIPRVVDEEGNYVTTSLGSLGEPTGNLIVMGDLTFVLADDWADNWFYQDGFFYCRTVLAPGETSPVLLEKVSLTEDTEEMREKYAGLTIDVDVLADILQAEGGAPELEWNVTVTGTIVSGGA